MVKLHNKIVIGYRMDAKRRIFVRLLDKYERENVHDQDKLRMLKKSS